MRYWMRTLGAAVTLAAARIQAAAQAEPAGTDFTLTTCGGFAELAEEDRAFAPIFQ